MASGVPGAGKKYGAVYGCVRKGGSGFFKGKASEANTVNLKPVQSTRLTY